MYNCIIVLSLKELVEHSFNIFTENPDEKDANLLFSPSSILTGIGMLYRGMEGETRENVREIMGFPPKDNPKLFRDAFKVCHV